MWLQWWVIREWKSEKSRCVKEKLEWDILCEWNNSEEFEE